MPAGLQHQVEGPPLPDVVVGQGAATAQSHTIESETVLASGKACRGGRYSLSAR